MKILQVEDRIWSFIKTQKTTTLHQVASGKKHQI